MSTDYGLGSRRFRPKLSSPTIVPLEEKGNIVGLSVTQNGKTMEFTLRDKVKMVGGEEASITGFESYQARQSDPMLAGKGMTLYHVRVDRPPYKVGPATLTLAEKAK